MGGEHADGGVEPLWGAYDSAGDGGDSGGDERGDRSGFWLVQHSGGCLLHGPTRNHAGALGRGDGVGS